ncbi:MAG TPA: ABC transporter substrate-binding protein, partial [Acetobacteraceae bacterium]|nr:ABC transporter substrate-binding protein [Acetobacteraceae bacterium]
VLGGAVLAPWTAHAQDASFAAVSAPVAALDAGLLAVMKAGSSATPFPRRYAMLEPVISQSFNLPHILQFAVGFDWPSLNASQRQDLLAVFREYTVASYVSNFTSYDGQQFHILPGLRAVGAEQVISTQIVPRSGAPHRIDYVLQQNGASWQIVDVLLDGTISQVAVQRSDFGSLLSSGGAPSLIAGLKKKVMSLSGNTMS